MSNRVVPLMVQRIILTALLFSTPVWAAIVYNNTTNPTPDTLVYAANGFTQIGDQISLAGTERSATSATVEFFSDGSAGTFDTVLDLFDVGSGPLPPVVVGSEIGSFTMTGVSAPVNDILDVTFALGGIVVPDNLIFTVGVSNVGVGVDILGLDMDEPPTVGSSDNTFAIANDGTNYIQTPTNNENVFFELDAVAAVPEPASCGLIGAALLALIYRRSWSTRRRP
jgi:hypothetical protein